MKKQKPLNLREKDSLSLKAVETMEMHIENPSGDRSEFSLSLATNQYRNMEHQDHVNSDVGHHRQNEKILGCKPWPVLPTFQ